MKNSIFISLLFCSIIFSSENERFKIVDKISSDFNLEFNLDEFDLEQKGDYKSIKTDIRIGTTGVIGMPKLPVYSSLVMVDPSKSYRLEYESIDSYIIENIDIIPNQRIVNGVEKESIDEKDNSFYQSSNAYPLENVTVSEPIIMRDMVLLNLSVTPFTYFPNSRQLEVVTQFDIRLVETDSNNDIRRREMPKSKVFENLYRNMIINYDNNRNDNYQDPSILYICSGSLENNSTFQQLVDWRKERGYVVYTASLSETGSSASSIKNYIENAYDNFNPPPEYVALVGDVGGSYSIPTYYEDFGHDSYGNECEGDLPYSQLDGSDLFPEVLVGRMSLRSTSELSAVVAKILNYEKATYLGNLGNYYNSASMAGDPSSSGNSCAVTNEAIAELLENHGFGDVDIKTSGSSWSSWMRNELSDGTLFFNYRGYLGMSGFNTSDVDDASNGYKLPFATVLTCGTGSFAEDQTSMSEKFFRAGSSTNPKGGVAAVGTATWNTHTLFNNIVDMGMYHGLLADKVETAGAALASGKLALYNAYSNDPYEWIDAFTQWNNLMGDPATHLWTDTPDVITVNHPNSISYGTNYFDVYVYDSSNLPIEGALVTIDERNQPTNIYTDASGLARFYLENTTSGNTLVTVTKINCKPYQGYMNIEQDQVNVNVDHGEDLIVSGDDDGIAEAGESINLSIPFKNYGTQSVSGVYGVLSSTSDHVIITQNTVNYGTIQPDETVYGILNSNNFLMDILPTAIQGEDLELTVNVYDGDSNNWISIIDLAVNGSHLISANTINVQPGQTASIDISLRNIGSMTASGVTGELSFSGDLITVNDANGTWGTITSGNIIESIDGFNITLSSDIIGGSQFSMNLHIESSQGYSRTEIINVQAGNVSVSDPLGPDNYGYYIYDSGDDEYSLAPSYNWIDIENTGTNLNLSNNGDGNWSGNGPLAQVDLPFDFKFYGINYSEITICTNGWISPGNRTMESFRNYPIPGAGGPSPMIAAFWDDLETGNNGDVYYQTFNGYVVIQWQDMRTQNNNSLETFQVIIYDNEAQPYGDNEIKIQYEEFNNTSAGSFSSYPPIHGAYSTIGIENHYADDGLQYTFMNQYPSAAMTLSDGKALFITTQPSITLPQAELNYTYGNLDFELEFGQSADSEIVFSNTGEQGSVLTYSVSQAYPEMNSPFDVTGGGPDSYGFYWTDSGISNELEYSFTDISSIGNQVSFPSNDSSTEMFNIGFEFPFYGETYTEFRINANGWIGFEDDNTEWYNGNLPSSDYPRAAIFGFWDDLNPVNDNCNSSCSGNVYYHSDGESLVVWFEDVYHWASDGYENSYYDFQIVIHSNGEIEINLRNIEGAYSATVGLQNASGTVATQVDSYDSDYFTNNQSFKFIRPFIPDWLSIESSQGLVGDLEQGESVTVNVFADASDAEDGEYQASITISTASNGVVEIPISLTVADMGLPGDLNGDDQINVSDVVILVNTILNGGNYSYSADVNQDGSIDVLDVVMLVGNILSE